MFDTIDMMIMCPVLGYLVSKIIRGQELVND